MKDNAEHSHAYPVRVEWTGNRGTGTASYAGYDRGHTIHIDGKQPIHCSSDASFRGDATLHNPEDLLVAAVSACHMLAYLAFCARAGIEVTHYEDSAVGTLLLDAGGGGRFTDVTLRPHVRIADSGHAAEAARLHEEAHARCFIASSCSMPIHCEPRISGAADAGEVA
jgi:organic hydroperoxide reductase OsmC/OhrA